MHENFANDMKYLPLNSNFRYRNSFSCIKTYPINIFIAIVRQYPIERYRNRKSYIEASLRQGCHVGKMAACMFMFIFL